jgi:hypothetical protein
MKRIDLVLFAAPLLLLTTEARDAAACGGCFGPAPIQQGESTQVTGHRMVLSVSKTESTLWDQFQYSGNPKEFAWVLPIHGQVGIGLSSDALFEELEQVTAVTISSPTINCPPPPSCGDSFGAGGAGMGGAGGGSGVSVIAQQVVGPYETVQLSSKDPKALDDWLANHGYTVPVDVQPVIAAYVAEGFDFLALKLVPGQGVSSMRPVRVTSPGASPTLPLRMVAAGTGATTSITLWVMGEGRYEPANFPSFRMKEQDLVWDWDTASSNYAALKQAAFAQSSGTAWLLEGGEPASPWAISGPLQDLVLYDVPNCGYGDGDAQKASQELTDDLAKLYGSIDANSFWWSRMHGELSRPALAADLVVGAAKDQSPVQRAFVAQKTIGTAPTCPTYPPCSGGSGGGGAGAPGGPGTPGAGGTWAGHIGSGAGAQASPSGGGGCVLGRPSQGDGLLALAGLGLAAAAIASRRRAR